MNVFEARKINLDTLIGQPGVKGRIVDFSRVHDLDASYLSQILNGHRQMGEKAARKLEQKIGILSGSLDVDRKNSVGESHVIYDRLRPDQIAILEGYEASGHDVKKAALRLFGVVQEFDSKEPTKK